MKRLFLLAASGLVTAGCTLNSVVQLPAGAQPSAHRAVIVYGVKVDGAWDYPAFSVQMDEYDIDKQNITGNCFTHNRTEATVSSIPGPVKYFAFDAPAGHYVYSPFHIPRLDGGMRAFMAPAGKTVYLGDFAYRKDGKVSVANNIGDVKHAIKAQLPELGGDISPALTTAVKRPSLFLCTP